MPKPKSTGAQTPPKPHADRPLRKANAKKPRVLKVRAVSEGGEEVEQSVTEEVTSRGTGEQRILPVFIIKDGKSWRAAGYEKDILRRVPWEDADFGSLMDGELPAVGATGTRHRPEAADDDEPDWAFAALYLLDVIPDPAKGSVIAQEIFAGLAQRLELRQIEDRYLAILDAMHRVLRRERDRLALGVFRELLETKALRFLMVVDGLPEAKPVVGGQYELDLFGEPAAPAVQNFAETRVAYLETQEMLFRWYGERAPHESDLDPVFVVEANGKAVGKGDVFRRCAALAQERRWSEMLPSLRSEKTRLEGVDAEGWAGRVGELLGK